MKRLLPFVKTSSRFCLFVWGMVFVPYHGFAQADSVSTLSLEEVIVSATRGEKMVHDVGRSVVTIDREAIGKSVYTNVAELLSAREGIFIAGTTQNPGANQSMFLRGASGNQSIIMIDGVRITDPSGVSNAVDLSELSLINVERIEIVRGSHGTLYGSSAIGGIVHIITRKGRETGFHADVSGQMGTFGPGTLDLNETLSLNYTLKNGLYFDGGFLLNTVRGMDATVDTVTTAGAFKNRDKDNFSKQDFMGKIGYHKGNLDAFVSFKGTGQNTDIDNGAYNDDNNYTVDFKRNLLNYSATYTLGKQVNLGLAGGYTGMQRSAVNDSSIVDDQGNYDHSYFKAGYKGAVLNNEIQLNLLLKGAKTVVGIGRYQEMMSSESYYINTNWGFTIENALDSIKAGTYAAFIHTDLNFGSFNDKLNGLGLVLGGRLNLHDQYGSHFTGEINPSWKPGDKSLVYASLSTGFNTPSLYQLYAPEKNYVSGISRGNDDLQPESSVSMEIGYKINLGKGTKVGLSVFHTTVNNVIEYVYLWDKDVAIVDLGNDWLRNDFRGDAYINAGKQVNKGVEVNVQAQLHETLSMYATLGLIQSGLSYSKDMISTGHTGGNHIQLFTSGIFPDTQAAVTALARRPGTASASVKYSPVKKWGIIVGAKYTGSRKDLFYDYTLGPYGALGLSDLDSYMLWNIDMSYDVTERFSVMGKVSNLLNANYQEILGYSSRGRGGYLKVRYRL